MVYELTVQAVQLKTTIFNPPAKLINACELSAAIGMLYRKAGAPKPELSAGARLMDVVPKIPAEIFKASDPKVAEVIQGYSYLEADAFSEEAVVTMEMGYEAG